MGEALRVIAWEKGGALGLTPTQGQILVLLRRSREPARLSKISAALGVTPATASNAVTALLDKALVKKAKDPKDQRAMALTLSEKGRQWSEGVTEWPQGIGRAVDTLGPHEKQDFMFALMKVVRALHAGGTIHVARMCVTCEHFRPHAHPGKSKPHHCALADAPLSNALLRFDCQDHEGAPKDVARMRWEAFLEQTPSR